VWSSSDIMMGVGGDICAGAFSAIVREFSNVLLRSSVSPGGSVIRPSRRTVYSNPK
jgi:hypothetical protein